MPKEKLIQYLNSLGLTTFGLIPCRALHELEPFLKARKEKGLFNEFEEQEIEKRIQIESYLPGAKTILSIAFPYYDGKVGCKNGFSVYTKRADYHKVVHSYLSKICEFLAQFGGEALAFTDSNALPERYLAMLANVGDIGRNQMLITKEYGSYVFLGEVLTTLDLADQEKEWEPQTFYAICQDCDRCIKACPGHALSREKTDTALCVSYLTQKKELTDEELLHLNGQIFGCDVCQMVCPLNEGKKPGLKEFESLIAMNEEASVYASCDKKFFQEVLKQTSCGWRGKNVINRNAMARMVRQGQSIEELHFASPYLIEYKQRIMKLKDK